MIKIKIIDVKIPNVCGAGDDLDVLTKRVNEFLNGIDEDDVVSVVFGGRCSTDCPRVFSRTH